MSEDITIKSPEQFENVMKKRREDIQARKMNNTAIDRTEFADHVQVANQIVKIINVLNIDPYIKKVMTLRILGPITTGKERTHLSIALELGIMAQEVREIEREGILIVNDILQKVCSADFVEKFNKDRKVQEEIEKEIKKGKSV